MYGERMSRALDAIVIGSGHNGLAAAIRLAQAGREVAVFEGAAAPGGCVRSAELTLPGFVHDPFAAVFPLAAASPFFRQLSLEQRGLSWIDPPVPLAHPLDDGTAVLLRRSVAETAVGLGTDREAYSQLMEPLVRDAKSLIPSFLAPPFPPRHPIATARFAQHAVRSAVGLACSCFHGDAARALLAGNAAHSFLALDAPLTAGFALFLGLLGHVAGWPLAASGAGQITAALVQTLTAYGGSIVTDHPVRTFADLPSARAVVFDTSPLEIARIAGDQLPPGFRDRLLRHRYGPAAFKVDFALDGPVPWTAPECLQAGTLHLGGTLEEIAAAEAEVVAGHHPDQPFVLASQPSLFDPTRAPAGKHTLWTYCHVPAGSTVDMTDRIEHQVERFAPGFRDRILARHVLRPHELEDANPNLVGGAINGGVQDLRTFAGWALSWPSPYATPNPVLYRCSSATPPGGGVHGMAGFHAAGLILRRGSFPRPARTRRAAV